MDQAIFALATAPGRSAVAVVRLSGEGAGEALKRLAGEHLPPARMASLRTLRWEGEILDRALVLWFPAPASYTGEDCGELHLHGGTAVVEAVGEALAALGLRPAEPGEFTRRAFENGKLDLTRAEAVADLVDAQTAAQRRQALAQLGGALDVQYARWRRALIGALAFLEAAVDFPDEDLPVVVAERARPLISGAMEELVHALGDAQRGERVREGFRIALIGAPNAGKSSLLNRLAGRDAAIVTARPGTTRDIIEVPLVIAGYRVLLADTAGLRETADEIEDEGVRRARAWAAQADLRIRVVDSFAPPAADESEALWRPDDLVVANKADLVPAPLGGGAISLSAATGEGMPALWTRLESIVMRRLSGGEFPSATRLRHRRRLEEALEHLARTEHALEPELIAEDVRLAARALERVTGRIDPEDVLDQLFGQFCIGK